MIENGLSTKEMRTRDTWIKEILKGLNSKQVEAVTYTQGPLLILAGAGSGKTTVLTRRVAYLIAQGVPASSILAITFTNKAAGELKTRIQALLGDLAAGIWASTFHSACVRILRSELPSLGLSGRFSILDTQDQLKIMRKVLKELNLSERQYPPSGFLRSISRAKENLQTEDDYRKKAASFYETKVAQAYELYQRALREMDAMDFDDLIMQTVLLLKNHQDIRERLQKKFQYILVDEYQDTNRAQYLLTRYLAEGHRNIAVVGDDDQSIYAFRGADIRNILDFEKDYPECHVVKLEQNYRSTQVILDGAYHVVSKNLYRKDKRLWTHRTGGKPITVYMALNEKDEANFVASEILKLMAGGKNLNSFAILYRTHAQSRVLEEVFMRRGIPYAIVGGLRFYERKEIKDALSYLRLLVYPKDIVSLERIANEPPRGFGGASVRKVVDYAQEKGISLVQALNEADSIKGLTKTARESAKNLGKILLEAKNRLNTMPLDTILEDILVKTGYKQYIQEEEGPEGLSRVENLNELLSSLKGIQEKGQTLEEYLETQVLMQDQDLYDEGKDAVVMMTLHAAKGLEFDTVFMVGMEEGLLPHVKSLDQEKDLEEERRLTYVGMTRARDLLYMTFAQERESFAGTGSMPVSRFLREIPVDLISFKTYQDG